MTPGERKDLVHALLRQTNLWDAKDKAVGGFSGGMKQRLGIAIALAGRPKLLIVDEPTAGLDPIERHRFLNLLAEIGEDVIVILSTHIVEDVRELCRQMAIINHGEVVLEGDPASVLEEVRGRIWRKRIRKAELAGYQQNLRVISTRLMAGEPIVNVYSDVSPGDGFARGRAGARGRLLPPRGRRRARRGLRVFLTVFLFELRYQLKRPTTWLFFVIFLLMAFFMTASEAVFNVGGTGQIHRNAPFVMATAMAVLTAIGQVITTAMAGTAVLRDAQLGTQELLFTTRLSRAGYLIGRFLGAFVAMLLIYSAMPIGLLLGSLMPWVPAEKLGPVRVWDVIQPFLLIALPNLLFISALLFAVGSLTRKLFSVYVTGIALLLVWQISQNVVRNLDRLKLGIAHRPVRDHHGGHRHPVLDGRREEHATGAARFQCAGQPWALARDRAGPLRPGLLAVPSPPSGWQRPEEEAQARAGGCGGGAGGGRDPAVCPVVRQVGQLAAAAQPRGVPLPRHRAGAGVPGGRSDRHHQPAHQRLVQRQPAGDGRTGR